MTFINVASVHETEWNKNSAVRAQETARVTRLVGRLLDDLSRLDDFHQPNLDYLDAAALDAVRSDPDMFHVVGRLAGAIDGCAEHCVATAYWPEVETDPVDVELDISDDSIAWGPGMVPVPVMNLSHHLCASVDAQRGRIARLALG